MLIPIINILNVFSFIANFSICKLYVIIYLFLCILNIYYQTKKKYYLLNYLKNSKYINCAYFNTISIPLINYN